MLWQALGSASGKGQKEGMEMRLKPGRPSTCQGWSTASNCTQSFGLAWSVFYIKLCSLQHCSTLGLYKGQSGNKDEQTVF